MRRGDSLRRRIFGFDLSHVEGLSGDELGGSVEDK